MSSVRIAIIGAGPSGLSLLQAFAKQNDTHKEKPTIVCFEKQSDWGGMWNLTWRTGVDEHGEPVHGSMYRHLWTNGPKECNEFPDYTFDHHFGKPMPSFLPRKTFRDYFLARAEKSNIRHLIRFNTVVRSVEFDSNKEFTVITEDLIAGIASKNKFDYVVVAIGHFSTPNMPDFAGVETFPGQVIHSHDFRDARQFANQNILVIGAGYSGEDIALQTYKFGAKSITISYRSKPTGLKWPSKIEEKPLITSIDGRTVHFLDGSQRDFDSIIYCTGYKHHFPFLPQELRLKTEGNTYYPDKLYKGIFFQDQPNLIYLGMQDLWYSFLLFETQAHYARDVIQGSISIPDESERLSDIKAWKARCDSISTYIETLHFQTAYLKDLVDTTGYPLHLSKLSANFERWTNDKFSNVTNYRNIGHTSAITNTTAVPYEKPWLEAVDEI